MYKLKVITASNRPGRKGHIVANWFMDSLKNQSLFDAELLDLGELNLPFMDEEAHPMMRSYQNEHTKKWSEKIDEADAFVFITCEYNYGYPAPLKNALDYLHKEWNYKPVGFVSYGGMSGGMRAVELLKPVLTTLRMMPIPKAVHLPYFSQHINENEVFEATEGMNEASKLMIEELALWSKGLKVTREASLEPAE